MVNAAISLEYEGKHFEKGEKLPDEAVKLYEATSPYLLDNYIEINGRWRLIDDPLLKGFVAENKTKLQRLRDYFKITDDPKKGKEAEDNSHMLRSSPIPEEPKKLTEKEVFDMTKSEQIELLKQLGETEIPKYEKGRVNKILELQNG